MQEKKVRQEVYRLLRNLGYWPVRGRDTIVCKQCGSRMHPPIGRPDILVLAPLGKNSVVEVKVVNAEREKAFALDKIRPEQRAWMNAWDEDGGKGYLAIGTVNVRPRRLWVVPWSRWRYVEDVTTAMHRKSIPVDLETYSRLPDSVLDIAETLEDYEMEWIEGQWWLPEEHELRRNVDAT